jgi:hypothetical protein
VRKAAATGQFTEVDRSRVGKTNEGSQA